MPNSVDAVLWATVTRLMWRGVERGAGIMGIQSFSSLLGAEPAWHERTDSGRFQHSFQRARLANMEPHITPVLQGRFYVGRFTQTNWRPQLRSAPVTHRSAGRH